MNGRHARKLRRLSNFEPKADRHYQQFNNSHNYVLGDSGRLEKGPGTIVEVTEGGSGVTPRAKYKYMKEVYYGRIF